MYMYMYMYMYIESQILWEGIEYEDLKKYMYSWGSKDNFEQIHVQYTCMYM